MKEYFQNFLSCLKPLFFWPSTCQSRCHFNIGSIYSWVNYSHKEEIFGICLNITVEFESIGLWIYMFLKIYVMKLMASLKIQFNNSPVKRSVWRQQRKWFWNSFTEQGSSRVFVLIVLGDIQLHLFVFLSYACKSLHIHSLIRLGFAFTLLTNWWAGLLILQTACRRQEFLKLKAKPTQKRHSRHWSESLPHTPGAMAVRPWARVDATDL